MNRQSLVSWFLTIGILLCAEDASAEVVKATGYGDTPGAAVTDAAANAIRSVSGSHVTIKQEFKTEIEKGIPDEKFLETMLEVSRGSIEHIEISAVKQVGNIYEASVIVDVNPGKLQTATGGAGALKLKPGTLSTGAAEARLKKDAGAQLQEAILSFLSLDSKKIEILSVGVEKNRDVVAALENRNLLSDGQVPVRVVFNYSSSPSSVSELQSSLAASTDEFRLRTHYSQNVTAAAMQMAEKKV